LEQRLAEQSLRTSALRLSGRVGLHGDIGHRATTAQRRLNSVEIVGLVDDARAIGKIKRAIGRGGKPLNLGPIGGKRGLGAGGSKLEDPAGCVKRRQVDRAILNRERPPPIAAHLRLADRGDFARLAGP